MTAQAFAASHRVPQGLTSLARVMCGLAALIDVPALGFSVYLLVSRSWFDFWLAAAGAIVVAAGLFLLLGAMAIRPTVRVGTAPRHVGPAYVLVDAANRPISLRNIMSNNYDPQRTYVWGDWRPMLAYWSLAVMLLGASLVGFGVGLFTI